MTTKLLIISTFLVLISSLTANASVEEAIAERIKAVGDVCIEGQECAKSLTVAASGPKSGEDVYNTYCKACHDTGAAGAPKFRLQGDWTERLANGLDTVYANAINGKGAMPPRGTCGNCSDDEINSAVDHMIEGLK